MIYITRKGSIIDVDCGDLGSLYRLDLEEALILQEQLNTIIGEIHSEQLASELDDCTSCKI